VTTEELTAVLDLIGTEKDGDWLQFSEGRTATFQVAADGVGFSVSRATALRRAGSQLQLRTEKGETCVVTLSQVFACVVDGMGRASRRAGFA
jgi:hypothetical protein